MAPYRGEGPEESMRAEWLWRMGKCVEAEAVEAQEVAEDMEDEFIPVALPVEMDRMEWLVAEMNDKWRVAIEGLRDPADMQAQAAMDLKAEEEGREAQWERDSWRTRTFPGARGCLRSALASELSGRRRAKKRVTWGVVEIRPIEPREPKKVKAEREREEWEREMERERGAVNERSELARSPPLEKSRLLRGLPPQVPVSKRGIPPTPKVFLKEVKGYTVLSVGSSKMGASSQRCGLTHQQLPSMISSNRNSQFSVTC